MYWAVAFFKFHRQVSMAVSTKVHPWSSFYLLFLMANFNGNMEIGWQLTREIILWSQVLNLRAAREAEPP